MIVFSLFLLKGIVENSKRVQIENVAGNGETRNSYNNAEMI